MVFFVPFLHEKNKSISPENDGQYITPPLLLPSTPEFQVQYIYIYVWSYDRSGKKNPLTPSTPPPSPIRP